MVEIERELTHTEIKAQIAEAKRKRDEAKTARDAKRTSEQKQDRVNLALLRGQSPI